MDSSEPKEKPTKSPDVVIEKGDTKILVDLEWYEWIFFAIIATAICLIVFGIE